MSRFRFAGAVGFLLAPAAAAQAPASALAPERARQDTAAITSAVRVARGLQVIYWDSLYIPRQQTPPRAIILAHYRRGYTDSLARVYTAYAVSHAPEPVMAVPDSTRVVRATNTEAVVVYRTPEMLREIWNTPAYTTEYLRWDGRRWRVAGTAASETRPEGY